MRACGLPELLQDIVHITHVVKQHLCVSAQLPTTANVGGCLHCGTSSPLLMNQVVEVSCPTAHSISVTLWLTNL